MGFFSDALSEALFTGNYICPECREKMEFENEWRNTLVCTSCGNSMDLDEYGHEEGHNLYPTLEELLCDEIEDDN